MTSSKIIEDYLFSVILKKLNLESMSDNLGLAKFLRCIPQYQSDFQRNNQ